MRRGPSKGETLLGGCAVAVLGPPRGRISVHEVCESEHDEALGLAERLDGPAERSNSRRKGWGREMALNEREGCARRPLFYVPKAALMANRRNQSMRITRALLLSCMTSVASTTAPCFVFPEVGQAMAATDEEKAGARALAEQAIQEAYPSGKYDETIDLLRRAEALVHSPTHWLYIGLAQAKLGHLVLAQEAFLKASREPIDEGGPEAFRVAVSTAAGELEALKPRIARVTVRLVGVEASTASVSVDGSAVPSALVGVPMPVDPGERKFQATAPGMLPATQNLLVTEGSNANVELALVPDPNAASTTPPPDSTATATSVDVQPSSDGLTTKDLLLYSGIGGAALGVGGLVGGFFVYKGGDDARAQADELFNSCNSPPSTCTEQQQAQVTAWDDEADSAQIPGTIMMGAGGVLLAAGATLIVVSVLQDEPQQQAGMEISPWVSLNGAGFSGRF